MISSIIICPCPQALVCAVQFLVAVMGVVFGPAAAAAG
jgi:hypothetical protein